MSDMEALLWLSKHAPTLSIVENDTFREYDMPDCVIQYIQTHWKKTGNDNTVTYIKTFTKPPLKRTTCMRRLDI